MQYQAFSISLHELEFSNAAVKSELIEKQSYAMLQELYNALHKKLNASKNPERLAESICGSLFCCCIPEGLVMLSASVTPAGYLPILRGFLVPQEFLRTAWRLCRVQLLYLCAAGWQKRGEAFLTLAEIDTLAGAVSITQEQAQRLGRMAEAMLGSEMPFSFAMTGFPQNLLPLLFPPLSVDVSADAFDSIEDLSEIRLPRDRCEYHYASLAPDFRQFPGLTLGSCSKRKYPDIYNAKHHYSIERQKKLKAEAKEKLADYPSDHVWYYEVTLQDRHYAALLTPKSCEQLSAGCLDFVTIYDEMLRFQKKVSEKHGRYLAKKAEEHRKFDEQLGGQKPPAYAEESCTNGSDLPKLRRVEPKPAPKPEEPKKKTGLFKNLFGNK